ncbi:MAG: LysR family transcriptional regulator [Pseudomonadota bacterium]
MWDEIRAAAEVAKRGTVSEAAKALNVHRATVIRRIDTLEEHLGRKVFQRHKQGYTRTEIADYILKMAQTADDQLVGLKRIIEGQFGEFTGELIVTSTHTIAPKVLMYINQFANLYPNVEVHYKITPKTLNLEEGEAHVAFRHFDRPTNPDYVIVPHEPFRLGLYASKEYIARCGCPSSDNLDQHQFVILRAGEDFDIADRWTRRLVSNPNIAVILNDEYATQNAIEVGTGVGFYPIEKAKENPDLVEVMSPSSLWCINTWIVTHVDLHRSPKVQAFLDICRRNEH